jgi:hypothetical protein
MAIKPPESRMLILRVLLATDPPWIAECLTDYLSVELRAMHS